MDKDELRDFNRGLRRPIGDEALLERVFIHRSYLNETDAVGLESNERLEFLGDAVLSAVTSHILYARFGSLDEGGLTRLRARLVNTRTLAGLATGLGLDRHLILGKGEDATGGRRNPTILAGVFEALIAAVYLDSGFAGAFDFIELQFSDLIESSSTGPLHFDYKPRLQELAQAAHRSTPSYRLTSEEGPPHERVFEVEVIVDGEVLGRGRARRKKEAEQAAAREAIERMEGSGRGTGS